MYIKNTNQRDPLSTKYIPNTNTDILPDLSLYSNRHMHQDRKF